MTCLYGIAAHTRGNDRWDFFGLRMLNEQLDDIAIGNRRKRITSWEAEEGRITGSFESVNESHSLIKCTKYFIKLRDFQNYMGALSPMELLTSFFIIIS